jgi:hypothetical protein
VKSIRLNKADAKVSEIQEIIFIMGNDWQKPECKCLWLEMMDLITEGRCRSISGYGG